MCFRNTNRRALKIVLDHPRYGHLEGNKVRDLFYVPKVTKKKTERKLGLTANPKDRTFIDGEKLDQDFDCKFDLLNGIVK